MSPFPGMDPFLESPAYWRDFHQTKLFGVIFDKNGKVMSTSVADDVRAQQGSQ